MYRLQDPEPRCDNGSWSLYEAVNGGWDACWIFLCRSICLPFSFPLLKAYKENTYVNVSDAERLSVHKARFSDRKGIRQCSSGKARRLHIVCLLSFYSAGRHQKLKVRLSLKKKKKVCRRRSPQFIELQRHMRRAKYFLKLKVDLLIFCSLHINMLITFLLKIFPFF